MMQSTNEHRAAILGDDQRALDRASDQLRALRWEPYSVLVREPRSWRSFLEEVQAAGCEVLISDHRLRTRANVDFSGAELVFHSNEQGLPAVLYSAHVDEDEAYSIRPW